MNLRPSKLLKESIKKDRKRKIEEKEKENDTFAEENEECDLSRDGMTSS